MKKSKETFRAHPGSHVIVVERQGLVGLFRDLCGAAAVAGRQRRPGGAEVREHRGPLHSEGRGRAVPMISYPRSLQGSLILIVIYHVRYLFSMRCYLSL